MQEGKHTVNAIKLAVFSAQLSVPPGRTAPFQREVTKLYLTLARHFVSCGMGSPVFLEGVRITPVTQQPVTPSRKTRVPYDPGQSGLLLDSGQSRIAHWKLLTEH